MDFADLLNDPAYRHVLLNHVPIIGLAVAWLVLAAGLLVRQRALQITGLLLVAVTAGMSVPVAEYGDDAYPAIFDTLDGHGRAWLDYHAQLAETWMPALMATAVLAVVAALAGLARQSLLLPAGLLVAMISLLGLTGAVLIGKAGGQVKHPEFRISEPPRVSGAR